MNQSKFTLKHPVITFRLPKDFSHPHENKPNTWIPYFRSNLYNVQTDIRLLEYDDTIVLSNTILPYLNNNQELKIWIRMCLLEDDSKPRYVYVDLNCDNAEGVTKEVKIIPKRFLKEINHPS